MPGRILIVDSRPTTRAMLRVKLTVAYYETEQAESAEEALRLARVFRPHVVIFGDSLPGNDPAPFVKRINDLPASEQIATIYIQSHDNSEARKSAIEAGVEDAISLPFDRDYLLARLRCIFRRLDTDREAGRYEDADRALGLAESAAPFLGCGHLTLIHPDPHGLPTSLKRALDEAWRGRVTHRTPDAVLRAEGSPVATDLYLLCGTPEDSAHSLALLSELRAHGATRNAAFLFGAMPGRTKDATRALDLGADDAILLDCSPEELVAWCERLIARRRETEAHRLRMQTGLQAALVDPLTGLWNRRYALPNLDQMVTMAARTGSRCSVMIADLDHFKRVNDRHGHLVGDTVLRAVAKRLKARLGGADVIARLGGEEFLILLPDTDPATADATAKRLVDAVACEPIPLPTGDTTVPVSVSIGIAVSACAPESTLSGSELLAQADRALYRAKADGRSRVRRARAVANDGNAASAPASASAPVIETQRRFGDASLASRRSA
ncbi:Response regulator PleD [Roseivivax sp. THAF40]|nr:Response regulator PleD [Roseivivax sp. THAF40]